METIYNKINPRKVLGCLMAFAMVLFSLNVSGQVAAPYSEDFNAGSIPAGWSVACDGGGSGFMFSGNPGYNASTSQGNTAATGTFAWIDFSGSDVGCWMQMVDIDVSSLTSALLTFDLFSDIGTYSTSPNSLYVEAFDGSAWNVVATFDQFTTGWDIQFVGCSGYDVGGTLTLRFRAESSGLSSDYYNDILIDNVSVAENNVGVLGCTDPTACNYNANATTDDGSCDFTCFGCTDPNAYNYSAVATIDDASCLYGCAAGDIAITVPYAGVGLTNCGSNSVTSANANTLGGNGYYLNGDDATYSFTSSSNDAYIVDLVGSTSYSAIWVYDDCPTSGGNVVAFSGSSATNENTSFAAVAGTTYYIVIDTWASPTCIPSYDLTISIAVGGCTDPIALNYDALATVDDGSCTYVMGCTDALACNYDAAATADDGSCTYPGCTDALAVNYDATAGCDDGSCAYSCTAAPYLENFDSGVGTWTTANIGTGSYTGWYLDASGTPSGTTGPSDDITGGGNYMFIETSAAGGPYTLTSECLDISSLSAPALRFYYHMYGATMGTLDVSVNGTSVWSLSGDQGNAWVQAQVDLSAYVGSNVTIVFTGTRGASFTGDMAIDNVEVDEMMSLGCTAPLACNYDASATTDDGSCTYAVAGFDCAGNCLNGVTTPTTIQNREVGSSNNYSLTYYGGTWSLTDATGAVLASDADGDDVTLCLPDGCYDITGNSGSGPNYPWGYSLNGGAFVVPGAAGTSGGSAQFTVGTGVCPAPMVNLFFSEYAEGSSNNKYLEIYNPTSNTVDLSDYAYPNVNGGASTFGVYEYWNAFDR